MSYEETSSGGSGRRLPSTGSTPNRQISNSRSPWPDSEDIDSRTRCPPIRRRVSYFYSKRHLNTIYRDLHRTGDLTCPVRDLPSIIRRVDIPLGMEVNFEEKWIVYDPYGDAHLQVMTSQQVKNQIRVENILHTHQLLQWSDFESNAKTGRDVEAAFKTHDKEDVIEKRRRYKSLAVEKGQVKIRRFLNHGLTRHLVENEEIFYCDRSGRLQGPFDKDSIIDWWKDAFFPKALKIAFGPKRHPFVFLDAVLGQWLASNDEWLVMEDQRGPQKSPISQSKLIGLFLDKQLRFDTPIIPWEFRGSSRGLPLLNVMVHCLPWSDHWLITDSVDSDKLPIREAYDRWSEEYGTDGYYLLARPSTWDCNFHVPIESLLDSYGFLE